MDSILSFKREIQMSASLHESGPWAPSKDMLVVLPSGVMLVPYFDPTNEMDALLSVIGTRLVGGWN